MSRVSLSLACVLGLGAASPALAQTAAPLDEALTAMLAPERAACAEIEETENSFEISPEAFKRSADFNQDGVTDLILNGDSLRCATGVHLYADAYDSLILVLVSTGDPEAPWSRHAFRGRWHQLVSWVGYLYNAPVFLMEERPDACGEEFAEFCVGAYAWNDRTGAFVSLASREKRD